MRKSLVLMILAVIVFFVQPLIVRADTALTDEFTNANGDGDGTWRTDNLGYGARLADVGYTGASGDYGMFKLGSGPYANPYIRDYYRFPTGNTVTTVSFYANNTDTYTPYSCHEKMNVAYTTTLDSTTWIYSDLVEYTAADGCGWQTASFDVNTTIYNLVILTSQGRGFHSGNAYMYMDRVVINGTVDNEIQELQTARLRI